MKRAILAGFALPLLFLTAFAWARAEVVTIEFSGWHPEVITGVIDRFNREHPHIQVEYVPGSAAQILTRIAGGSPPDVYRESWAEFGLWIRRGLALDLTPLIERDREEVQPDDIWPPAYQAFVVDGKQYALPHHVGGNLTYINKERFASGGVALPEPGWTYERDFPQIAAKLSLDRNGDGVVDQWGFANPNHWGFWAGIMASNGGNLIDLENMVFAVNTEIGRSAIQYVYDLVHLYKGAPGPDSRPNSRQHWLNGDAAMVLAPATPEHTDVDFDFEVVPNPHGTVRRVMPGGAQPLAIYPGSEHIEEAWTFIKWVVRADVQAWISNELGLFPPVKRSSIPMVEDPVIRTFGLELENQLPYTNVLHSDIVSTFNAHLDAVLRHEESVSEAAFQIQHQLTVKLEEALRGDK